MTNRRRKKGVACSEPRESYHLPSHFRSRDRAISTVAERLDAEDSGHDRQCREAAADRRAEADRLRGQMWATLTKVTESWQLYDRRRDAGQTGVSRDSIAR